MRFGSLLLASVALLTTVWLAAPASAGTVSSPQPFVPRGSYLAVDESGRLFVLSPQGKLLRRGPQFPTGVLGLALSPDRQSAYVSVYVDEQQQPPQLYEVALDSGEKTLLANAISPALSPDGDELAYLTVAVKGPLEIQEITALVIRNLQTGTLRTIPFPADVPLGNPPELIINWSPHGHFIALRDGSQIRIVNVASAQTVESQPALSGPWRNSQEAPVFLAPHTLVVMPFCCQRPQPLEAVKIRSGGFRQFAFVSDPVENVFRVKRRTLLVVTAVNRLVRVTEGHRARLVTKRRIVAVTP